MGIELGSAFTRKSANPLDDSLIVADLTARNALASGVRYEGMLVYVTSEQTNYQLIGGVADSNWQELSGSGGGVITVADIAARNAIATDDRYDGLLVYVIADQKNYQLRGGTTDSYWVELYNSTGEFNTIDAVTASATLTASQNCVLVDASSGDITLTLPAATLKKIFNIVRIDSSTNVVTVAANGTDTIFGNTSETIPYQYKTLKIVGLTTTMWGSYLL